MLMSSIIKRVLNTRESPLNIIMSHSEDSAFLLFLQEIVSIKGTKILSVSDSLMANTPIDLIICNSRITQFDKCFAVSNFFQCPMIIIDHTLPSHLIDPKAKMERAIFPHLIHVARSKEIYDSWGKYHDLVLDYEFNNEKNTNEWRDLIYKTSKINFQTSDSLGVE